MLHALADDNGHSRLAPTAKQISRSDSKLKTVVADALTINANGKVIQRSPQDGTVQRYRAVYQLNGVQPWSTLC